MAERPDSKVDEENVDGVSSHVGRRQDDVDDEQVPSDAHSRLPVMPRSATTLNNSGTVSL